MKKLFYTIIFTASAFAARPANAQVRVINSNRLPLPASQQIQLQGSISFADNNTVNQLQQGWNLNLAQAAGSKIKVELWQVNYVADKKDNTVTDILLGQKITANISYQVIQNSLSYTASYNSAAGNVVAIAFAEVTPNAVLKFTGSPNDGTPASVSHQFKSDARKYLGNGVIYGIYSLPHQAGNIVNVDFRVKPPKTSGCKTCFGIDDVWNTVSDVANDVVNFAKATVSGAADAISNLGETIVVDNGIFFVQCFGVIATYLQSGELPKVRKMSDYPNAYAIANSTIFMNTLPPENMILVTNLESVDKRPFTVPFKNGNSVYILMNLGNAFEDPLNYNMNGFPGDVFRHELTHAWQIWHNDALRLFEDGAVNQFKNTVISNQYKYNCDGHNLTDSYNEEQQAMIVQNFYSMLFFSQNGLFDKNRNKITCGFEQQWVVKNILGNRPANADEQFTATSQIFLAAYDRAIAANTGGPIINTIAFPSNGNRTDGTGFFLPGKNNNSFFYYSSKTRDVSANWGPVRDKFTKAGYEFGELGWPERNEALLPDGVGYFQKFNHGFIYWHPKYGAYVVLNKIFDAWKETGWEKGKLGYPVSDYVSENVNKTKNVSESADKGYQKFAGGVIFYQLPSLAVLGVTPSSNNNYCTVSYGDPNKIMALHFASKLSPDKLHEMVPAINPQPLPPVVKKNKQ